MGMPHVWVSGCCAACKVRVNQGNVTEYCPQATEIAHACEEVKICGGSTKSKTSTKYRIYLIKLVRAHTPEELNNGLLKSKEIVDLLLKQGHVTVLCRDARQFCRDARQLGYIAHPTEQTLSPKAQTVLEALQSKPDLWEEIQEYMGWPL